MCSVSTAEWFRGAMVKGTRSPFDAAKRSGSALNNGIECCAANIKLNPVRAGTVQHSADYPWSSYRANAQGQNDELINPHDLYRRLGRSDPPRLSAYRQLFGEQIAKEGLETIRESTHKGWAMGNDRFRAKVERLSGRRAAPLPRPSGEGN